MVDVYKRKLLQRLKYILCSLIKIVNKTAICYAVGAGEGERKGKIIQIQTAFI